MAEKRHPLEVELNAPAEDILEAIHRGFRAKTDAKGKLAELYLNRALAKLKVEQKITDYEWYDRDGKPDFVVTIDGVQVVIECKNVRTPEKPKPPKEPKPGAKPRKARVPKPKTIRVELQKTRNSKDGTQTRRYKRGYFDILGVSLFNETGAWQYEFVLEPYLAEDAKHPGFLKIMQPVPALPEGHWSDDLYATLKAAAARKRKT